MTEGNPFSKFPPRLRIKLLKVIDPAAGERLEAAEGLKSSLYLDSLSLDGNIKLQDIPNPTPLEKLQQLQVVYNRFSANFRSPFGLNSEEYAQFREERRSKVESAEFRDVAIWMEGLLNCAPTTCGFDLHLMRSSRIGYSMGVNREVTGDPIGLILGSRLAEDGAFFNTDHTKEYERTQYRRLVEGHTETQKLIGPLLGPDTQRLEAQGLTDQDIDEEYEDLNAAASEMMGHSVNIELNFRMMQIMDRLKDPWWIREEESIYTKGPLLKEPHVRLPSQQLTEVELIPSRWRRDYLDKYNDEP